jgi:hypothetical protein
MTIIRLPNEPEPDPVVRIRLQSNSVQQISTATPASLVEFASVHRRLGETERSLDGGFAVPFCKQAGCLSNCLTTGPNASRQLWTMLDPAQREAHYQAPAGLA